jgi:alpha-N-arabinofuranosidase
VLREARDYIDGLSIHHYSRLGKWGRDGDPADFTFAEEGLDVGFGESQWWQTMRLALNLDEFIQRTVRILDRHDPEHRIGLILDEWGTWHLEPKNKPAGSVLYQQNTMRDAVVAGLTLDILHAHAGRLHMANIAQMVNVLQAMILTDESRLLLTPTYHVFEMSRVHHDATLLAAELTCPQHSGMPTLSASASRNAAGVVHISLTNLHPTQAATLNCALRGVDNLAAHIITGRILTAASMDAHNTFALADTVAPVPFTDFHLNNRDLVVVAPAKSVIVLAIK